MITVENLTKKFKEVMAVDNISFICRPGEIFGLLGANGAGKTTTIRLLATMLKPSSGRAAICGFDLESEGEQVRRNIGVLSGDSGLYHRLTAEENIRYFGKLYGLTDDEINRRINQYFPLLEMEEYRRRKTDGFSKGMKQKVNVVRAVIHDPPVLMFDEPTAGLDVMSARTVLQFIASCRENGKCILFSTHIMSEAEKLCDRIGIIHRGTLAALGTKEEILAQTGADSLENAFVRLVGGGHGV